MPAVKRELLDGIGFDWNPHETKWNDMYARLAAHKKSTEIAMYPETSIRSYRTGFIISAIINSKEDCVPIVKPS
jgi:hypothetical protein